MFNRAMHPDDESRKQIRKPYCKPKLEILGDLRSLTLGGSFGAGESGGTPRKVKTGAPLPGDYPFDDPGAPGNY